MNIQEFEDRLVTVCRLEGNHYMVGVPSLFMKSFLVKKKDTGTLGFQVSFNEDILKCELSNYDTESSLVFEGEDMFEQLLERSVELIYA